MRMMGTRRNTGHSSQGDVPVIIHNPHLLNRELAAIPIASITIPMTIDFAVNPLIIGSFSRCTKDFFSPIIFVGYGSSLPV